MSQYLQTASLRHFRRTIFEHILKRKANKKFAFADMGKVGASFTFCGISFRLAKKVSMRLVKTLHYVWDITETLCKKRKNSLKPPL